LGVAGVFMGFFLQGERVDHGLGKRSRPTTAR
jgi:hypothetical protein